MGNLAIDVSKWNKGIDIAAWRSMRDLGRIIIKCGGSDDGMYQDSQLERHYEQSVAQGLKIGYYFYSAATTKDESLRDARYCLDLIKGRRCDLPVYIDIEERAQLNLSMKRLTEVAETFCDTIEAAGYRAGIYSGTEGFSNMDDSVCSHSLWLAYWAKTRPKWATKERGYDLWQQGSMSLETGMVYYGWISGYVDCDWWIGREETGLLTLREQYAEMMRGQLGVDYWSMHEGPKGSAEEGWGCAMLAMWGLNELLGTKYYGSCWHIAGSCMGRSEYTNGKGEFEWVDSPKVGDIILYRSSGRDGRDPDDYGHAGVYVGDGKVISALGSGAPDDYTRPYVNIGVTLHDPDYALAWGTLDRYRYCRCVRLDNAPTPVPPKVYSTKLWKSNNTVYQQWHLHTVDGTDSVRFYNPERGMWLNVGDIKDGKAPVRVELCEERDATRWILQKVEAPYVRYYKLMLAEHPQLVLDARDGGTHLRTGIQAYRDNGTIAQRWILVDSGDGIFRIISAKSGLAIDCGAGVQ